MFTAKTKDRLHVCCYSFARKCTACIPTQYTTTNRNTTGVTATAVQNAMLSIVHSAHLAHNNVTILSSSEM